MLCINYFDYKLFPLCAGNIPEGVLCVDKKVFSITNDEECTLDWSKYGLQIDIPAQSVSAGETTILEVKAIVNGDFTVPPDCYMISSIYWIRCPVRFNNRVTLHLSHAAIIEPEEDISHFKFYAAKCSSGPPYVFSEHKGGSFAHSSRSANIQLQQFSFFGLFTSTPTRLRCCFKVFYRLKQPEIEWDTIFVIIKDDPAFHKVSSLICCVIIHKLSE